MKKNKMRLTLHVMAQLGLKWRLKTSFKTNLNEINNTKIVMDETMVSKCTSPLLLQTMFFIMQIVGIPFQNCFAN
jgi:hypothetical protein